MDLSRRLAFRENGCGHELAADYADFNPFDPRNPRLLTMPQQRPGLLKRDHLHDPRAGRERSGGTVTPSRRHHFVFGNIGIRQREQPGSETRARPSGSAGYDVRTENQIPRIGSGHCATTAQCA